MEIIYILLPLSLILAFLGIIAYFWSVKTGQLDDLETPKHRIIQDEEEIDKRNS
jgi:cbb3-type cytochrome oxidase maturation protein